MLNIQELPDPLGSWIWRGWDGFQSFAGYFDMPMSWIYVDLYKIFQFNLFRIWVPWSMIPLFDTEWSPLPRWKLMVRKKSRYPVVLMVGYIGISYRISYGGLGAMSWLGNMQRLSMAYRQWKSSINDTNGSQDNWRMLPEDMELRRGIL